MSVSAISLALEMQGVSSSEKLVMIVLANYADEKMECYPSHKNLAKKTCLTDRTVRAVLRSLEERRLISREERRRGDGGRSSDVIRLHFSGVIVSEEPAEDSSRGAEMISYPPGNQTSGGAEAASYQETKDDPKEGIYTQTLFEIPTGKAIDLDLERFDVWYAAYPKKVARPQALRAYRSAIKKTSVDVLLAGAEHMANSDTAIQFIPNPATWLNQERWADEKPLAASQYGLLGADDWQ